MKSRERFVHLAEKRVIRTIKDLKLIGNLANKSNYSYDQNDADRIIKALEEELKLLKGRFESAGNARDIVFKL